MISAYPNVAGEVETIHAILSGRSIARIGDGEIKMIERQVYTRELVPVPALSAELRAILDSPHENCLLGIPTMDPKGTKYQNWQRYIPRFCKYLYPNRRYYSALITRPDCGAWMETPEYYRLVNALWSGKKHVVLVAEAASKLREHVSQTNRLTHIECPSFGAYAHIRRIEKRVLAEKPDLALLSAGPTATCLAHRLSAQGIHAVDIGSIGGFLLRWRTKLAKGTEAA